MQWIYEKYFQKICEKPFRKLPKITIIADSLKIYCNLALRKDYSQLNRVVVSLGILGSIDFF